MGTPLRIGVSACLIGQKVRYNGDHKRSRWATDELASFCSFVPVCPEVEIGLGIPRPTIRLVQDGETVRLVEPKSGDILTGRMDRYSKSKVRELEKQDLDGFILKKDSPSCGMERVKVHQPKGSPRKNGVGRFALALLERLPLLPVEEEGRLNDARLRENFVERLFAWRRVRELFRGRWSRGDVVRFHTAEKFLVLSHDRASYTELGRLVAKVKQVPRPEFAERYKTLYMNGLRMVATTRKHTNVLQHMQGHLKDLLDRDDRAELTGVIDDFRRGLVPLVVPVTLIRHHVRRHDVEYLKGQQYLEPHPKELMLRNHT